MIPRPTYAATLWRGESTSAVDGDGYARLALAVIQLAVADLQHGSPEQKRRASADIAGGGLEHWMDMVCVTRGSHQCLRDRLQRLCDEHNGASR